MMSTATMCLIYFILRNIRKMKLKNSSHFIVIRGHIEKSTCGWVGGLRRLGVLIFIKCDKKVEFQVFILKGIITSLDQIS